MAEQDNHNDVVKSALSVSGISLTDTHATQVNSFTIRDDEVRPAAIPSTSLATEQPTSAASSAPASNTRSLDMTGKAFDDDTGPAVIVLDQPRVEGETSVEPAEVVLNGYDLPAPGMENNVNNVLQDGGTGSDTDTSRADNSDHSKDAANRHLRSNSVKKPTSFKAVSVTKSFLSKSATPTPPPKIGGDKVAATGLVSAAQQPAAKPRLVAKTGSGLRDTPRLAQFSANGGSGPDASTVWNKNRPVQPPPPKQFTDEELKQQYGIHLATRLQADEAGREPKWADIDDDEDDWAPETVEWADGTKSTLTAAESQPLPVEEPKTILSKIERPPDSAKPVLMALQRPSSTGSPKTILKPGGSSQAKTGGLVLKGAQEKPTLVAKPPAPTPVKSPWAPLPPIDKASPVVINPPLQPASSATFSQQDVHGFDAMPPRPSPAKEIAADDFDRHWRDSERGNRELFNSQSGRYEPVKETRRSSVRHDQGFRQPAVLQRPSQHGQSGPAEPSAAFQTSRSSGQADGSSWGRRRASSNVSGGSGPGARRMSINRPSDLPYVPDEAQPQLRRGSQTFKGSDAITSPSGTGPNASQHRVPFSERGPSPAAPQQYPSPFSPIAHHVQPVSPQKSTVPIVPFSQEQQVPASVTNPPPQEAPSAQLMEDPVAMQDRLMREKREKRELAIRRRQEEEEKAEAEKKERIRLKMASLGLPPLTQKITESKEVKGPPIAEAALQEEPLAVMQSSPKTPVTASTAGVAQYGQMKVHQPQSAKKPLPEDELLSGRQSPREAATQEPPAETKVLAAASEPIRATQSTLSPPKLPNGPIHHNMQPHLTSTVGPESQSQSDQSRIDIPQASPRDRKIQNWKPAGPVLETHSSWGANSMTTHSVPGSNVWGPPGQDRALGNGTFDSNFSRFPPRHISPQQAMAHIAPPGPIAPPTSAPRISPQAFISPGRSPVQLQQQSPDHQRSFKPPQDAHVNLPVGQGRFNGASPVSPSAMSPHRPGPIGPPRAGFGRQTQQQPPQLSGWQNLPAQLQRDKSEAEKTAKLQREAQANDPPGFVRPLIKETFRQTSANNNALGAARRVVNTQKTVHGSPNSRTEEARTNVTLPPAQPPIDHPSTEIVTPLPGLDAKSSAEAGRPEYTYNETWRRTALSPTLGSRRVVEIEKTSHAPPSSEGQLSPQVRLPNQHAAGMGSLPSHPSAPTSLAHSPSSFANPPYSGSFVSLTYGGSPPPDSYDHPVCDGDSKHPHVVLPTPKAVVKLPPTALSLAASEPNSVAVPSPTQVQRAGTQPIAQRADWQQRFNGLFGKTQMQPLSPPVSPPTPAKVEALAVSSASKAPMDVASLQDLTTVSLPQRELRFAVDDSEDIVSKPMTDELLEDREFGSLPTVRLARTPHENAYMAGRMLLTPRPLPRFHKVVEARTREPWTMSWDDCEELPGEGWLIPIRLPGQPGPLKRLLVDRRIIHRRRGPRPDFQPRVHPRDQNRDRPTPQERSSKPLGKPQNKKRNFTTPQEDTPKAPSPQPRSSSSKFTPQQANTLPPTTPVVTTSNAFAALANDVGDASEETPPQPRNSNWPRPPRGQKRGSGRTSVAN